MNVRRKTVSYLAVNVPAAELIAALSVLFSVAGRADLNNLLLKIAHELPTIPPATATEIEARAAEIVTSLQPNTSPWGAS